jgi:hypothetical protein
VADIFALELICIKSKSGTQPVTDSQTKRRDKSRVQSNAKAKASVTQRRRQSSLEKEKRHATLLGAVHGKIIFFLRPERKNQRSNRKEKKTDKMLPADRKCE